MIKEFCDKCGCEIATGCRPSIRQKHGEGIQIPVSRHHAGPLAFSVVVTIHHSSLCIQCFDAIINEIPEAYSKVVQEREAVHIFGKK